MTDYRWRLDGRFHLLTTLSQYSWLHLIIATSLISTRCGSLQHTPIHFSLLYLHPSFPGSGFNSEDSSASALIPLLTAPSLLFRDSLTTLSSESGSELLYDWRFTANQFVLATRPLRPMTRIFIFQLYTCGYIPHVTSSLMRRWVCHLQLLSVLVSAAILRSDSRGIHDHILLSQIQDSPNL
jgi:hypothetical protein